MLDVYESAVEASGHFGVVFERDDETAYFYLFDLRQADSVKIASAFNTNHLTELAAETPIAVRWSFSGTLAGLFVRSNLLAVFDLDSASREGCWATTDDRHHFSEL